MRSFETRLVIGAPPERVWRILVNGDEWSTWNTTVRRLDGRIALGEKVTVHVTASPGRAFPVTVVEMDDARRMVWRGGMPLGLFVGERSYTLRPVDSARTEFSMRETYSGLLAPLIARSIPDLQPAFDEFATCLKRAAEREQP